MLSIIIPSRCGYLQQTVDDLLLHAEGEIEIIIHLDGWWPDPMLRDDPRVRIIHSGVFHNNIGMRAGINKAMAMARGEYVMKIDEQCSVDQGFDVKLAADCEDNWVVIPRRKRWDPDKWEMIEDGRPPVDYMRIDYPYQRPYDPTCGLHGAEDRQRYHQREDILIDDTMTMQGSCYFMKKSYWDQLFPNGLEDDKYGPFTQEAQEISNKAWLSGGRVVVNKKTWYAHSHKGSKGKRYGFSTEQYKRHCEWNERGRLYCINYWLYTKDYEHDFEWLVNKFWPLQGWPANWKETIEVDKLKDFSTTQYKDQFWLEGLQPKEET